MFDNEALFGSWELVNQGESIESAEEGSEQLPNERPVQSVFGTVDLEMDTSLPTTTLSDLPRE
jgi:hypothetical protein